RMFSLTLLNRDYWYLLFFAAIVLNGPLAIGLQFLPPRYRWVRVVWFDGYLLFAVTMLTAGTFVMLIPLAKMLQDGAAP
ncbi:MAG TPA: hypothetical protein VGE52_06870, partial [Pirellulales bacterium]